MNRIIFSLLVILTTGLMGSSFTIGKLGLAYSSPLLLVAMRFTLAGLIMATIVKILNKPHPVKVIDNYSVFCLVLSSSERKLKTNECIPFFSAILRCTHRMVFAP